MPCQLCPKSGAREILALLPELHRNRPNQRRGATELHAEARRRLFEAMVRVIAAVPQPLVLFLDDIQWADRDTLEWIGYFLRMEDSRSVVVLATLRRGEVPLEERLDAVLLDLRREGRIEEISLESLNAVETAPLLANAVAGAALEPAAVRTAPS